MIRRLPVLLVVFAAGLSGGAARAKEAATPEIMEPMIVEGERGPLDSNAGIYRKRLPCIGSCEDAAPEQTLIERVLNDLKQQMRAVQQMQQPKIYEARSVQAPSLYRLDDKQP